MKGVSTKAHQKEKLERIIRYISRPTLSEQRLSLNSRGKIIYELKTPYDNGTKRIVLEPLDFLSRLASPVPRPGTNLLNNNKMNFLKPKTSEKIKEIWHEEYIRIHQNTS